MKIKFRILLVALLSIMFSVCPWTAFAVDEIDNIGVSISNTYSTNAVRSVDEPTAVWNIASAGRYSYQGFSYRQLLYTNYKFTGRKKYTISTTNTGVNDLTVQVVKPGFWGGVISKMIIPPRSTYSSSFVVDSENDQFYLSFTAWGYPYSFNGYIF